MEGAEQHDRRSPALFSISCAAQPDGGARHIDSAMEESARDISARLSPLFRRIVFPLAMRLPRRRLSWCSSRCSTTSAPQLSQRDQYPRAAGVFPRRVDRDRRPDRLRCERHMVIASQDPRSGARPGSCTARLRQRAARRLHLARRKLKPWQAVDRDRLDRARGGAVAALGICCCRCPVGALDPRRLHARQYVTIFRDSTGMMGNTLLYCGVAAGLDVIIGTAIAYLILRPVGRQWLEAAHPPDRELASEQPGMARTWSGRCRPMNCPAPAPCTAAAPRASPGRGSSRSFAAS